MKNAFLEEKIKEARGRVFHMLEGRTDAIASSCLYNALVMQDLLGPQCRILAGSYQWQFTSYDDGQNATHFACMFDRKAQIEAELMIINIDGIMGQPHLPEMHVYNFWCGKLLDISTLHVPQFAANNGFQFEEALTPPDYLFTDRLIHKKGRYVYQPHSLATKLAVLAADRVRRKVNGSQSSG